MSGDQDYELRYVAEKYGLSDDQVKTLIPRVGNDREMLVLGCEHAEAPKPVLPGQ